MIEKIVVIIATVSLAMLMVNGCDSDAACKAGECCRRRIPGMLFMRCDNLGKPNDRCGGQTKCPCIPGYDCVPDGPNILNRVKSGNGTCQPSLQMSLQQEGKTSFFQA